MVVKNIGLTGSSGLVGMHLIPMLLKKKYNLLATSRKKIIKKKNINFKVLDLNKRLNYQKLDSIFKNIDCLIHMGAILPGKNEVDIKKLKTVNYTNSKILIDWASKRNIFFIFFSSLSIYYKKKNLYTKLKKKIEEYVLKKKMKYLILRPSSIYGHSQKDKSFLLNKINEIKKNNILTVYKPTNLKLNFIHAHDVCRALVFLLQSKKMGVYNIKSDRDTSINSIIKILEKVFFLKSKTIYLNKKTKKIFFNNKISHEKIKKLGWKSKITLYYGVKKSFVEKKLII